MNIGNYVRLYSEDLRLKNYSESTIKNYCSQVALFLSQHQDVATKPSEISERQIKEWLLEAKEINSRKHRLSAVKLFYQLTGKQPLKFKHIEYPRANKKLPIPLSQPEVQRMFDVCDNLKHRVIMALLYSCGLRVSELINLKKDALHIKNGCIFVMRFNIIFVTMKKLKLAVPESFRNLSYICSSGILNRSGYGFSLIFRFAIQ